MTQPEITSTMKSRRARDSFAIAPSTEEYDFLPSRWWIPGRSREMEPPKDFVEKLKRIDEHLEVGWNAEEKHYEIWVRDPKIKTAYCAGWRRLFKVADSDGHFRPLDNRTLGELYVRDGNRYRDGEQYFNQMVSVLAEEKAARDKDRAFRTKAEAKDYWKSTLISVAMRGKSSGSKFSKHHAGD